MGGRTEAGCHSVPPSSPRAVTRSRERTLVEEQSLPGLAMNEKLRPSASCCPASLRRGKVGGWVIGGTRQQPSDLRAALAACPRGRCRPGQSPPFTPQTGPQFPKAAPGSEAPGAPPFASSSPAPGFPGPGVWAGRPTGQAGREGAGWLPKSAPSYMWEEVAVTQVSRGPWARRERARAAPLHAAATVKKKKPRAAPQAA